MMRISPKKKRNWLLRLCVILVAGGMVAGGVVYFAVSAWIEGFLRGDGCREMLARQIGDAAHARCELEPVTWSGWNAYSARASLEPEGAAGWRRIEADVLQASLDWSGVRRGVWHVPEINLDWLRLSMGDGAKPKVSGSGASPGSRDAEKAAPDSGTPAWMRRWLPTRTEIGEVDVRRFDLKPSGQGEGVTVDAVHIKARPAADEGAWKVNGEDGRVLVPGIAEAFRLGGATARFDAKSFVLDDAMARWLGESEVTARGEVPFAADQGWGFSGRVTGLDLRHVLSDAWKPKLGGVAEGDYEVSGRPGGAVLSKGKLRVKNGVVQSLALLERVADFTHTERFRRVVLDQAAGDVEAQGARMRVRNLVLQSNGLIRVEGDLSIDGRMLDGSLRVGVSPGTLRWMPGAQNHVFTDANAGKVPGFLWTHVRVSGTIDSPTEDLSNRLLAAMGQAVLIDAPMQVLETGLDGIGRAGGSAVPAGKSVIEGGKDVIKGAGEAAGKGLDALKGFIPLLPR